MPREAQAGADEAEHGAIRQTISPGVGPELARLDMRDGGGQLRFRGPRRSHCRRAGGNERGTLEELVDDLDLTGAAAGNTIA